jgi:peptidoglycan/xylan/chitin deacetylase (PgdA/CDA1 family)
MKYLHDNNYYFPTWEEIYEFVQGTIELPKKSIVVTADDGNMTFFELAIPVLNKYNVKATSFLVTSWVNVDYVNSFRSDLICFESHSHNMHVAGSDGNGAFLTLTEAKAKEDLDSTKEILQSPIAFCYPFGHYNDFAKRMLTEEGFKVAVTTESGKIKPGMDPLELPRVRISKGDTLEQFVNKIN